MRIFVVLLRDLAVVSIVWWSKLLFYNSNYWIVTHVRKCDMCDIVVPIMELFKKYIV